MEQYKILLIGQGGREMALLDALLRSPSVKEVHIAPGSDAMEKLPRSIRHAISADDVEDIVDLAKSIQPDLTLIGPEAPLALGLTDHLKKAGFTVFAPSQAAARIESSKEYAKELMVKAGVPTANFATYVGNSALEQKIKDPATTYPIVLKENGLRAGKGVSICHTVEEAEEFLAPLELSPHDPVILEEFLQGYEFSLIVLAHDEHYFPLPIAQDHKPLLDSNLGPNTGGMGAVSPVPRISKALIKESEEKVIRPILKALKEDGNPFTGFLYAGLMATQDGVKVIEFNARFGDPEAEVILPRLQGDFAQALFNCLEGQEISCLEIDPRLCLGVVLASPGYPVKVTESPFIPRALTEPDDPAIQIFHMGSKEVEDGQYQAKGGRVIMPVCLGDNLATCQRKIYNFLEKLPPHNFHYRKDIGNFAEEG